MNGLSLGIDLGTSGIRSAVLDEAGTCVSSARATYEATEPERIDASVWWNGALECLRRQMSALEEAGYKRDGIARIGVDGTSGSMVLVDDRLRPVTRALMYNSAGFTSEAEQIAAHAPDPHIARGTGSAMARMLRLQLEDEPANATYMLHQADLVVAMLRGVGGHSDYNNALKTGFDPESGTWPGWAEAAGVKTRLLPEVHAAGAALGPVSASIAAELGLHKTTVVHAGTTDSIAAYLAAAPGAGNGAVTSLGTTLAIKCTSETRIDAPEAGLYSHMVNGQWLVGGASNTGGGVLLSFFDAVQIAALSERIDPDIESACDFYPLLKPGERFPRNDPALAPRMTPRPQDDAVFLHGLFESMARIEAEGYRALADRGAPWPDRILTAGGGARNPVWTAIRQRVLGCDVAPAPHSEASIGVARLIRENA